MNSEYWGVWPGGLLSPVSSPWSAGPVCLLTKGKTIIGDGSGFPEQGLAPTPSGSIGAPSSGHSLMDCG